MKKINEEVLGKKRKSFNVRRFAAVAASVLALAGTTVFVEAKFGIVDRISNLYNVWQDEEVVLNEEEKEVISEISLEGGCEFEVSGGRVRIDGIMYDSSFIYLMYTAIADEDNPLATKNVFAPKMGTGTGVRFLINGRTYSGGWSASDAYEDMDENEEGHQGCYAFHISPLQYTDPEDGSRPERMNNFSLSQGDEIILTDRKYINKNYGISGSIEDVEVIYATLTLEKPVNELVFTCENTEGMEVLETITEIRVSPISVTVIGNELLRKTYPEGIGYKYFERVGGTVVLGSSGDREADSSAGKYAVNIVKKDGTVVESGSMNGYGGGTASGDGYEYFYSQRSFDRPLDLAEVDYILVRGWGLEYKIPVNVEE